MRTSAPLKAAADAETLDTTDLDVDAAYAAALRIVRRQVEAGSKRREARAG